MSSISKIKKLPLAATLAFVSVLAISACSDSGNEGMDDNTAGNTTTGATTAGATTTGSTTTGATTTGDTTAGDTAPFDATFLAIRQNVFNVHCIECHSGTEPPAQLSLESIVAYPNLVGVTSTEVPAILRVAAGDPDNSYLIQKLEGTASVGARMPFLATPLPAETIGVVRAWISAGAVE